MDDKKGDPSYHVENGAGRTRPDYADGPTKPIVVQNILSHFTRSELLEDVQAYTTQHGLTEHLAAFEKGALLGQHPASFEHIPELSEEERNLIAYERAHKWSHPASLYVTIFICSIGAATQGWDQTGSNGANLSFPTVFGIAGQSGADPWIVGIVNSAPYIASAFLGCWLSDPFNSLVGRRGVIFITAIILIATPIASGFTKSWQTLFVCRLILGLGMGMKGSTVPIFAAENSPPAIRGALVMSWQLWTAFGIFLGTAANVICLSFGDEAWRYQLGSAFIPAVPLAFGIWFCPESPRWLMKKGNHAKAFRSLRRLRYTDLQAARDCYLIAKSIEVEREILGGANYVSRFIGLFTVPRVRRATLASFTVMIAQQMCGINIIAFYSSTIFAESGFTARQALYASLGFGAINFLFAFPAVPLIDSKGRRTLLLVTFPLMALGLLGAGLCALIRPIVSTPHLATVALFVYLFAAFYSVGEGPVPFTYSAEVFPLAYREQGMAWAVATCLFWASVLSLTFPSMLAALKPTGSFILYAAFNVIALVMIFLFVPETKGRTLEELDDVFNIPTATFIQYQMKVAAPYWINRYVLRKKGLTLAPLIVVDEDVAPIAGHKNNVQG